mmetsp:Transcript_5334/g.15212  ORF Transcript_5334/g.15212 Transcript_5334/m.15212 type:complete len:213 (+) Transcript_5334:1434-2072(+)
MFHEHAIQKLRQVIDPAALRKRAENRMSSEKLLLPLSLLIQGLLCLHVSKTSARDANETQLKWVDLPLEHREERLRVVHEVHFRHDADGSFASWIDLPRNRQGISSGEVCIPDQDSEDETSWIFHERQQQVSDLLLNVRWLVTHGNTSDPWQINEREVDNSWRRHPENDRERRDKLPCTTHALRLANYLLPNLVKVFEFLARPVLKLSPLST